MSSDLIYTFHASATALSGVVNNPSRTVIPSLASVALASTGGLGTTVVTSYDRGGVVFDTAYSAVRGEMIADDVYSTVAEVAIDNLTVFERLHVDALRATVRSRRDLTTGDDAEITFQAEYFGLVVDGVKIVPELDLELFAKYPTYATFLAEVTEVIPGGGNKAKKHYRERFEWTDGDILSPATPAPKLLASKTPAPMPPAPRTLRASVAKPLRSFGPGYRLSIPRFGRIRLGEVVLKPGQRSLSLLQIDFDKREGSGGLTALLQRAVQALALDGSGSSTSNRFPESGTMTIASVEGNGTPIWPKA